MKFSLSIGVRALAIEGDSKLIIEAVKGQNRPCWSIEGIIGDIRKLILGLDLFVIDHSYKEGGKVLDALANMDLMKLMVLDVGEISIVSHHMSKLS